MREWCGARFDDDELAGTRAMSHVCDMPAGHEGDHHCEVCEQTWGDDDG